MSGDPAARFRAPVERVDKPWGYELVFAVTDRYCGKLLHVRAGESLSLQYHERKDEVIYVHGGRVALEIGELGGERAALEAGPGEAFRVRPGVVHRVTALEDADLLEASTADLDDVVRLEDRYGRAGADH